MIEVRIRGSGSGSAPKCHRSPTLLRTLLDNVDKASICFTQRRRTEKGGIAMTIIAVLADREITTKSMVFLYLHFSMFATFGIR